jgi:molybdopterin biosynthesis enzyme
MISVNDAQAAVIKTVKAGRIITLPLLNAAGFVLEKSIKSSVNSPPFDQSAMDGDTKPLA